tara:strand:+ start:663 stop:836 length:174 start_codon:yes stop_codon:yes gene_type:complete
MRITYHCGKLWLSLTTEERNDVNKKPGRAVQLDKKLIKILHEDISEVVKEILKENER